MTISETDVQMIEENSKNIDMHDIGLFWHLTIKTIDDLKIIGNENLTLEMYIMQLTHLKNIDIKKYTPPPRRHNNSTGSAGIFWSARAGARSLPKGQQGRACEGGQAVKRVMRKRGVLVNLHVNLYFRNHDRVFF